MDTLRLNDGRVKMIAHRGVSGIETENTCAAFVAAGNRSYFGIETDVHLTRDGRFIIIHDDSTARVADQNLPVEDTDFCVLRSLKVKDRDGERADLVLPALEEYIRICRRYEKMAVLELKNHMGPGDIARVIEAVQGENYLQHTIFISFDLPNMICVRSMAPKQKAQFLIENAVPRDLMETLNKYRLDLDIDYHLLTPALADTVHQAGHEINVWTVNDLKDARRLASWGVDYITSNIIE